MEADTIGPETVTSVLPNEVLLYMFRFLGHDDLEEAEKVCRRWKTVVETHFAAKKKLFFWLGFESYSNCLKRLKRYGPSMETLTFHGINRGASEVDWAEEIADCFPNLLTVEIRSIQITNNGFKCLSTQCCQLQNVTLEFCNFTDEGLRCFLQAIPGITYLKLLNRHRMTESSSTPEFRREKHLLPQSDASAVFSTCRNLKTYIMGGFDCSDTANFLRFCKECVPLRKLVIECSHMPIEMFAQIQYCSWLEELGLKDCPKVDSKTLSLICKGCSNLRSLALIELPLIGDEGLKCVATCRNLSYFEIDNKKVTDETLIELANGGQLRQVKIWHSPLVSDRGCAALFAHCPQLELLCVMDCKGVGNDTVDSAIEAVGCRQNGLVLELKIRECSITPHCYGISHPLLYLNYAYT